VVECKNCGELNISRERHALGYFTCLTCGEKEAQTLANTRKQQVAPVYNKGAYQYITENDLETIGR